MTVMIIEDDDSTRQILSLACSSHGYTPLSCASGEEALERVSRSISAIILDLGLPDIDGPRLLQKLLGELPWVPCFILTATDSARVAVDCLKAGARDYFTKPVDLQRLFEAVGESTQAVSPKLQSLSEMSSLFVSHQQWKSEAGRQVHNLALEAAALGVPVLISGEHGSGRMTQARMIHGSGPNHAGPLHVFNAANPSESCLDTALFGRSGVLEGPPTRGLFQRCAGGTLVIAAVDKMCLPLQARLAKALVSGRYQQKGSSTYFPIQCRVVCTTSADLEAESNNGQFSKKLWLILKGMHIRMPSLKNRIEDIPILCARFLTDLCVANQVPRPEIPASTMNLLLNYHWPENLDELRHCMETAHASCKGRLIAPSDLPRHLWNPDARREFTDHPVLGSSKIDDVERASLVAALSLSKGNRRLAAQRLGVSLRTIYNMIRRHKLSPKSSREAKA